MSDESNTGVLYTDYSNLAETTPIVALWSYESCTRGGRPAVARHADGSDGYWLERSDPLLSTILPGTSVSLIVNFGDRWTVRQSLVRPDTIPRACAIGPFTQSAGLQVGRIVRAVGAVLPAPLASRLLGVPASALVDCIQPLQDFLAVNDVCRQMTSLSGVELPRIVIALRDDLLRRVNSLGFDPVCDQAAREIRQRAARVSIDELARSHGLGRQQFSSRFGLATGLSPKLFARMTRFHALVRALLSADVSKWASVSLDVGYYDQAHMINEFRTFAGLPPTRFFQPPRGANRDRSSVRRSGWRGEWRRRPV